MKSIKITKRFYFCSGDCNFGKSLLKTFRYSFEGYADECRMNKN